MLADVDQRSNKISRRSYTEDPVKATVLKTFPVEYGDLPLSRLTSSSVLVLDFMCLTLCPPGCVPILRCRGGREWGCAENPLRSSVAQHLAMATLLDQLRSSLPSPLMNWNLAGKPTSPFALHLRVSFCPELKCQIYRGCRETSWIQWASPSLLSLFLLLFSY